MVRLEHIGKRYGNGAPVLADVSLAVEPGGFCCVTGDSGAGKTTLLSLLCLAELPSQGKLTLFGTDTGTLDRAARAGLRRRIGMVFQDLRLIDELSAHDNVAVPLRIAGVNESQVRDNVPELLAWVGLQRRNDRPVRALSAGERQLVAIARAVVGRPELLVADEPASNLDRDTALALVQVLERLNRLGTTVLIATRDREFAGRFAGGFERRRCELDGGRLALAAAELADDR